MNTEQNNGIIEMRIWQFCSHLRGVMTNAQLQEFAIAFTFLRRIDCLIGNYAKDCASFYSKNKEILSDERLDENLKAISGGYPFYNYSGYTFKGILHANNSIDVVLNSYLQGFSQNVLDFLEGMNFKSNLAILQRQSRYLVDFFETFSDFDLSSSSVDNEQFVGLITSILSNGMKGSGEFFTNAKLSNIISECLLNVDLRKDKEDISTLYDPVCGTGSMLAIAGEKAKRFAVHQDNIALFGQDISLYPSSIAKALILLTGNERSIIQYGNTLIEDLYPQRYFQYILADIPFGLSWKPIEERIMTNKRFLLGTPALGDSQFLFIEHIISKMDPQGCRAAFISNASALWTGNAQSGESRIRRWMFENDMVETIIALPSGIHTTSNVPLYLWIITNKKYDAQKGKVRLIDTTSINRGKRRVDIDEDFAQSVIDEYKSNIISMRSQIVNNDQFGYYEVVLLENGKKKEKVTISLDTDIHDFVAKERQPYSNGEISIDYGSVEKGYSVQFEKFFTQEQIDIVNLTEATKSLVPVIDSIASIKHDVVKILGRSEEKAWNKLPLRAAIEVVYGINRPPVRSSNGLPIISVPFLRNSSTDEELYEVSPRAKCSSVKDAIVVMKGENAGEVFKGVDGILSPSVAAIKCTDESIIVPQYLYYLLKGHEKMFRSLTKGATIKSLDWKSILDVKCMIPPVEEQMRIVSYLNHITGKIDDVLSVLGGTGNVFSDYRQVLIENVVRGRVIIK